MKDAVEGRVPPAALRDRADSWWTKVKASDEFLDPLMETFFTALSLPNLMRKSDYHVLAAYVPRELIADGVVAVLDRIVDVAKSATSGVSTP